MVKVDNVLQLLGDQKAAIVMLSLSGDNAIKVFSYMNDDEITIVSHAMSNLGKVSNEIVDNLLKQLAYELVTDSNFLGNLDTTERLLKKFLNQDQLSHLMEEIRGPRGKNTWEKLSHVSEESLATYCMQEHPQTVALIMSKISPLHASKVMGYFSDDFVSDILSRILNLDSVQQETLKRVESVLREEFIHSIGKTQKCDSIEMLAEIFNQLDRNSEDKFMSILSEITPEAALKVKDKMFTFADLVKIDSQYIQVLLRSFDRSKLVKSLKGATTQIKQVILGSMSQRAAKIIEEEIQTLGPIRVKAVDSARAELVAQAKSLIDSGEIEVMMNAGDDEFIT
ncbi:flagellar motor switch protein FliG [Rickettsia endosymbiont of Cardiosporidium cionae]|uniref:flagellar motor switch protein FliG n=1 Tax=Rickettsia endosymbiont of Cardiosporidium cionae TaxID=2777155 RepID=UPI0018943C0E|nr:flagellar motor switch protein FliG [Rickettsia endosymbiont of Cardiosporidium cionae]KAF8818692.1 Flagellar motor switch protein FliG [Rickettsia endosymbiont of Cardiosporidium cionae]